MPELPEVETQVRDLQALVGRKILDLTSDTPKSFRPDFKEFQRKIRNKKILAIERRAKFIVFTLSQNLKLVVHFRMTGHFLLAQDFIPLEKAIRHFFKISGGIVLQFSDIRKFGTLVLCEEKSHLKVCGLAKLGVEPLGESFTLPVLREILQNKKGKLKAALLDQTLVAGIGNIYADEICFGASLHPASLIQNLEPQDFKNLFQEIKKQLRKGVRNRGTTIGEYRDTRGRGGKNQNTLMAYKRHGLPCKICGTKMRKIKIVQRTTSFCPKCQK
ncbi:MAG: bifunctional DNA-formamidopyrimidine glycosylase/DNA-(apurinic or apyrimidinic site) lyase [Candidatus Peribacteraceae bacterium]|nr:bifunctional DNA-formamidopyrimidine glycosylase/DNA-(apurinic or apyrimidinic site) lyase [Candidatus Peribacteraceae bacterium]